MKIVIMAGGSGTRLWPLSRKQKPKQFQKLLGETTMLQESVDRLLESFDIDDIYISTNEKYRDEIIAELPELREGNIILEPAKRDTAPAIGLAAVLANAAEDEAIAFLTSDHYIQKKPEFRGLLQVADKFVSDHPEYIVTMGITPTCPETGYGYIKFEEDVISTYDGTPVHTVETFVEKPNLEVAQRYLRDGSYLWNSGMFIVTKGTIMTQFATQLPATHAILTKIEAANGTDQLQEVINAEYPQTDKISIDFGIMEHMDTIAVIPADIGWSDVGSWAALKDIVSDGSAKHSHIGNGEHLDLGSEGVLVHSEASKLITTIGLKDIVIVETDDILLVCDKNRSQDVKKVVELLESKELIDKL